MIVTKSKFKEVQNMFYKKLLQTPYSIQLEVITVIPTPNSGGFSMDSFVGDQKRDSKFYKFQALYEKEIPNRTREKYGLPQAVNGIVYLSPKQLVPTFGEYHLNWNRIKVHFEGRTQVINKIVYLEELYDSCVGLQIFVQDDIKGG